MTLLLEADAGGDRIGGVFGLIIALRAAGAVGVAARGAGMIVVRTGCEDTGVIVAELSPGGGDADFAGCGETLIAFV